MYNRYNSLSHKTELTLNYLEYIVSPEELDALVAEFNVDYCAEALTDAILNPFFSHRLAAIVYYSLLLQSNQQNVENMVRH